MRNEPKIINLFFIPHHHSGAGTYSKELISFLSTVPEVKLYIIHTYSDKAEFNVETDHNNITNVYFPTPIIKEHLPKNYYRSCTLLLQSLYSELTNLVFHFNWRTPDFAHPLKTFFNCSIVYTHHYLEDFYTYLTVKNLPKAEISITGKESLAKMLDMSDAVICVTEFAAKRIKEFYNTPDTKIRVIYNGLNSSYRASHTDKNYLKKQYGFNLNDRIILYVGVLEYRKGLDCLLMAFKELLNSLPNSHLLVAGTGDYDKYHSLCKGFYGKVTFTGNVTTEEIKSFYAISDIGVLPSRFEQCSYTAIEMMHFGLPIIVSDLPGVNELFKHGINALLCPIHQQQLPPYTVEPEILALKGQMIELLTNQSLASKIGANSQKDSSLKYSREEMGHLTLKTYKKALNYFK